MPDKSTLPVKCLIVDDEPMARDVIRNYIENVPSLSIVGEFGNAIDATLYLQSNSVDIIFLDIRMPQLSGTDFVRSLRKIPKIIFTTAHKEFAHEGFELDVVDYLLKPIRFDRFLRAVNKVFPHSQDSEVSGPVEVKEIKFASPFIYVRVDRKMVKVLLDDIVYIESNKDYVKLFTTGSTIITRQTISSVEAMLSENKFFRIHRSYIVSLDKITTFSNEFVEMGKKELPIGKLYRNGFLKLQQG
jgi:two-component system, LytTR family, response regulator